MDIEVVRTKRKEGRRGAGALRARRLGFINCASVQQARICRLEADQHARASQFCTLFESINFSFQEIGPFFPSLHQNSFRLRRNVCIIFLRFIFSLDNFNGQKDTYLSRRKEGFDLSLKETGGKGEKGGRIQWVNARGPIDRLSSLRITQRLFAQIPHSIYKDSLVRRMVNIETVNFEFRYPQEFGGAIFILLKRMQNKCKHVERCVFVFRNIANVELLDAIVSLREI